jgi:putative aminopeptidase FrvX
MHTANEIVHEEDMKNTTALLAAVLNEKYGDLSEKEV